MAIYISVLSNIINVVSNVIGAFALRAALLLSFAWNLLMLIVSPLFLRFCALEPQTKELVVRLVLIHNVFNAVAFPFSGALSNGL